MTDALLTLIMPADIAQAVEDVLFEHPELVPGFTTSSAAGHGSSVRLVEAAELVSGHAPRTQVQMVGDLRNLQAVLALLRDQLPHARLFYWLLPVLASGRVE